MSGRILLPGSLILALVAAGCDPTLGADPTPKADKDKPAAGKPATHKVEKGPFKVEVTLKGVFESPGMIEVALSPKVWSPQSGGGPLVVKQSVEHGTAVRKDDPILWLDLERIDQTIRDIENDRQLAELAIKLAEEELPALEKSTPVDLALAEQAKKLADEDLNRFLDKERDLAEKLAHFSVKRISDALEYAREELKQLEKMYRAKELTEETEEIILKRQRNEIAEIVFFLKVYEARRDHSLKVELPRREQGLKENAQKATLALDKARSTLPLALNQKRLALDKLKYERAKAKERLQKLHQDREAMTVKAPADGIIYHGKAVRGQWPAGGPTRLQPGAMVQPDEVFMTIVKRRPLVIRAAVEEKDLAFLRLGTKGKVVPTSAPDLRLNGQLEAVSPVPITPGNFDARVSATLGEGTNALMPGMACSVKFVTYLKESTLVVPAAAVFTEEMDDDKHYVYLTGKGGKPEKRPVTVGKRAAGKVEIVEGLKEGDEILTEKPTEGKKEARP